MHKSTQEFTGERCIEGTTPQRIWVDHQGTCFQGSCSHICVCSTACIRESAHAKHQGQEFAKDDVGVQNAESSVLGPPHMGPGIFCGEFG